MQNYRPSLPSLFVFARSTPGLVATRLMYVRQVYQVSTGLMYVRCEVYQISTQNAF